MNKSKIIIYTNDKKQINYDNIIYGDKCIEIRYVKLYEYKGAYM